MEHPITQHFSQSYQWFFNGTNAIAGATNATLLLTYVQQAQSGIYSLLVSNSFGSVLSSNAVLTVNPAPACADVTSGLVGWWKGENNVGDYTGSGTTGVLVGDETYGLGKVGFGFVGDGDGDGVIITNTTALQAQALTIDAWVSRQNAATVSKGSGGNGVIAGFPVGGYLFYLNSSGQPNFAQLNGASASATPAISDTNFHHLAVSFVTNLVSFYIDGSLVGTANFPTGLNNLGALFCIGFRADNHDNSFFGTIDEVGVYNRALSLDEIKAIYNANVTGRCYTPTAPLIIQQPASQIVFNADNINLSVAATGTPLISYQWFFGTNMIVNATNTSLVITNAQPENSGVYFAVISNSAGVVASSSANVEVSLVKIIVNGSIQTNSELITSGLATVQLVNLFPDGYIFYTTDGSEPTPFSAIYSGELTFSSSAIIRTFVVNGDFTEQVESDPFSLIIVPTYTLTTGVPVGGVISASPVGPLYFSNTLVTLTATADAGSIFLRWTGAAYGVNPTTTVLMDRDRAVNAVFGTTLGKVSNPNGTIVFDPPGPIFPYGYTLHVAAVPNPGNAFIVWGKSASGNLNPITFTVSAPNPEISAFFAPEPTNQFSLAVVSVGHGQVSLSPSQNIFTSGESVIIAAYSETNGNFLGWSGDATGSENPLTNVIHKDTVIYANFSTNNSLTLSSYLGNDFSNGVEVDFVGEIGLHYELDESLDLSKWSLLDDFTNTTEFYRYLDLAATNAPAKYYRTFVKP